MNHSGVVDIQAIGREKHYRLRAPEWKALLQRPAQTPQWVCWPPFWSALEQIWLKLHDPQIEALEPLMLSSAVRQLMLQVRPAIERAGTGNSLSDDRNYLGETYLPVFFTDVMKLLT